MEWFSDIAPTRWLGAGTWLALCVLWFRSKRTTVIQPTRTVDYRWLTVLVLVTLAVRLWFSVQAEATGADDWLYLGYAHWISGNPSALATLFTELTNPAEPTIRVLPLLWLGFDSTWIGSSIGTWALITLLGHSLAAWLVTRLSLRLGLSFYGAYLSGLLFLAHPIASETLLWLSSGREAVMMANFLLLALCAHLDRRYLFAGIAFAAALLSREHTLAFLVLAPLCDWRGGRPFKPRVYLSYLLFIVIPMFIWRAWLFESGNAVQSGYLAELFDTGAATTLLHGLIDMPGWFFVPFTYDLPGAVYWAAGLVAMLCAAAWHSGGNVSRPSLVRWVFFLGLFSAALLGPSVLDLAPPEPSTNTTHIPDWNLRHLYGPAIGVAVAVAAALQHIARRYSLGVVGCLLLSAIFLSNQYLAPSHRVQAARAAQDSAEIPPHVAVRFTQPQDAAAVFFLNRRILESGTVGLPVLVGEPRCGCVALPIDYDIASVPRLRDVWHAVNDPLVFEPVEEGESCRCKPWRTDAAYRLLNDEKYTLE